MPKKYVIYDVRGNVIVKVKARKMWRKPQRPRPTYIQPVMGFDPNRLARETK